MKNSILYIVGAVVLLGGGAYLFLKNKNKKDVSKLADLQTANIGVATQTQAQAQAEVKNAEDVKKLAEATELAKQIDAINQKIESLNNFKNTVGQNFGFGQSAFTRNVLYLQQINNEKKKLVPLVEKLKDLGFTESYGLPVKIR